MGRSTAEVAGLELLLIKSVAVPNLGEFLCTRQMWRSLTQDAAFLSVVWPIRRVYPRRLLTYVPGVALLRISKTALATLFMSSTTRSMKGYLL